MFRVFGKIDGVQFDEVFASVSEWRAERALCERAGVVIVVRGMHTI